jgi:site-specific DNA recombinase
MQVAIYARVSTQRQAQAQTIEQQLERLRAYVEKQGWELLSENVFRDDGISGSTLKRPGLDSLRDKVVARNIDCIVITAPDRLARNYVHQMLLLEEWEKYGCRVEFLDRPISQDPHDQLVLQIRGAVAEYERTLIADRMRRGRQAKYRAGILLPWTRPLYGYQLDPDHPRDPARVTLNETEAVVVREMFAFYFQEKTTLYGLIQHLHAMGISAPQGGEYWSTTSVRAILTNPAYTGQVYVGRTRIAKPRIRRSALKPVGNQGITHASAPKEEWIPVASIPAVITRQLFERVQTKLSHNQQVASRNNTAHPYLLRSLVSCGVCNLSCMGRTVPPGYDYYICRGKINIPASPSHEHCPARFIPAHQLDELVWLDLCQLMTHPELIKAALQRAQNGCWLPQELQARRENLRRGQIALNTQLNRLTEAYLNQVIPLAEYQRRRADLEGKIQGILDFGKQLTQQVDRQSELSGIAASIEEFCRRIQTGLESTSFEQKRKLVELLIDRVVVKDGNVEIRYVIPSSSASEHVRFCHLRKDYFNFHSFEIIRQSHHGVQIRHDPHWSGKAFLPHADHIDLHLAFVEHPIEDAGLALRDAEAHRIPGPIPEFHTCFQPDDEPHSCHVHIFEQFQVAEFPIQHQWPIPQQLLDLRKGSQVMLIAGGRLGLDRPGRVTHKTTRDRPSMIGRRQQQQPIPARLRIAQGAHIFGPLRPWTRHFGRIPDHKGGLFSKQAQQNFPRILSLQETLDRLVIRRFLPLHRPGDLAQPWRTGP